MHDVSRQMACALAPLLVLPSALLRIVRHVLSKQRASGYSIFMQRHALFKDGTARQMLTTGAVSVSNVSPETIRGIHVAASYRLATELHELSLLHTTATLEKYVQAYAIGQLDGTAKGVVPELLMWTLACNDTHREVRVTLRQELGRQPQIHLGLWDHPYFDIPCLTLMPHWTRQVFVPILNEHAADMFVRREVFDAGSENESMILSGYRHDADLGSLYSSNVWMWTTFYVLLHEVCTRSHAAARAKAAQREVYVEFWKARDALSQFFACVAFFEKSNMAMLQNANAYTSTAWQRDPAPVQYNTFDAVLGALSDAGSSLVHVCSAICNRLGVVPYDMWAGTTDQGTSVAEIAPRDAYALGAGHVHASTWQHLDMIVKHQWSQIVCEHAQRATQTLL